MSTSKYEVSLKNESGRTKEWESKSLCGLYALISVGRNAISESVWCLNRDRNWHMCTHTHTHMHSLKTLTHRYRDECVECLEDRGWGNRKKRGFKRHWQALTLFLGQWQEAYSTVIYRRTIEKYANGCSAEHARAARKHTVKHTS